MMAAEPRAEGIDAVAVGPQIAFNDFHRLCGRWVQDVADNHPIVRVLPLLNAGARRSGLQPVSSAASRIFAVEELPFRTEAES